MQVQHRSTTCGFLLVPLHTKVKGEQCPFQETHINLGHSNMCQQLICYIQRHPVLSGWPEVLGLGPNGRLAAKPLPKMVCFLLLPFETTPKCKMDHPTVGAGDYVAANPRNAPFPTITFRTCSHSLKVSGARKLLCVQGKCVEFHFHMITFKDGQIGTLLTNCGLD